MLNNIKKVFYIGVAGILSSSVLSAKQVGINDIENVTIKFMFEKKQKDVKIKKSHNSKKLLNLTDSSEVTMYLQELEPEGWVLISADDIAKPVLAYSYKGNINDINDIPPQMKYLLDGYDKQIKKAKKDKTIVSNSKTSKRWKELQKELTEEEKKRIKDAKKDSTLSTLQLSVIFPALDDWSPDIMGITWSQGKFYNNLTPFDSNSNYDDRTLTGCVATAMAQIMRYHSWPTNPTGVHSYVDDDYGLQSVNYANVTYDFSFMPTTSLSSHNFEVAELMYHSGVSVDMDYGISGSGAYDSRVPEALQTHFRYWTSPLTAASDYSFGNWSTKIIQNIRQGFPVYYRGHSSAGGHAWVITGFETEGGTEFYMNYGWDGQYNAYFTLNDITPSTHDFNNEQYGIFHIKPNNNTYLDRYEGDNDTTVSSFCAFDETQENHSINPKGDIDWITTYIETAGDVTFETMTSQDTEMWLYDKDGNELAYNDDYLYDDNIGSHITKYLSADRYYIKVTSNNSDSIVSDYDFRIW